MTILDTHIWIWLVTGDPRLLQDYTDYLQKNEEGGLGVCAISCWEVAKLVEGSRIKLSLPASDWLAAALAYPGIRLLALSPEVSVESTQLPGAFHRDPADLIIVATARLES